MVRQRSAKPLSPVQIWMPPLFNRSTFTLNNFSRASAMRKIATDQITLGDVIAADVTSQSGNVLMNKGAAITPAMGRRLRNWGIAYVYIEGEEGRGGSAGSRVRSAVETKSELYDIFFGTLDSAKMRKIFDAVCNYKIRQQGGE